jgi:transposase
MESYLGIDVSKGYSDFALLDQNKQPLEEVFQLDDTREGHDKLKSLLEQFITVHKITELYCGVESTGGFENNWYGSLTELGKQMPVKVTRLNPSGVKKNIEAGLKRNITDALSAAYIAEYLICHSDKIAYSQQQSPYVSFRDMHTCLALQKKQNTQLINQLKAVLYSSFPEMARYCKDSMPAWVLKLLAQYPSPGRLTKVKPGKLAVIPSITLEKAQAIIEKAKTSIASRNDATREFMVKSLSAQILEKQATVKQYKDYLAANCKGPEVDLLQTIKGIGTYSAASVMIEIEDIKRFPSPKHLVSYFGLHPELKQSGDKMFSRMSKKGRSAIRATLYMCAQTAVVYDPHLKQIYHRHRSMGKTHRSAIGIVMHKLLRIIWGVLSSAKPYDSQVDKANQQKSARPVKDVQIEGEAKKRRFLEPDPQAPTSSKRTKKIKAYLESKAGNAGQIRDHLNTPNTNLGKTY